MKHCVCQLNTAGHDGIREKRNGFGQQKRLPNKIRLQIVTKYLNCYPESALTDVLIKFKRSRKSTSHSSTKLHYTRNCRNRTTPSRWRATCRKNLRCRRPWLEGWGLGRFG